MTDKPDEATAQPDGDDVSADELVGEPVEPEHDADPASFRDTSDEDDDNGNGGVHG